MCHLYPYNNVKLLRKFFYINDRYTVTLLSYIKYEVGTLIVDGCAVTFGNMRGLGGAAAHPGPSSPYQISHSVQCRTLMKTGTCSFHYQMYNDSSFGDQLSCNSSHGITQSERASGLTL